MIDNKGKLSLFRKASDTPTNAVAPESMDNNTQLSIFDKSYFGFTDVTNNSVTPVVPFPPKLSLNKQTIASLTGTRTPVLNGSHRNQCLGAGSAADPPGCSLAPARCGLTVVVVTGCYISVNLSECTPCPQTQVVDCKSHPAVGCIAQRSAACATVTIQQSGNPPCQKTNGCATVTLISGDINGVPLCP